LSWSLDFFLGGQPRLPTVNEFLAYIDKADGKEVVYNNRVVGRIYMHPIMGKVYVTERSYDNHVFRKWKSIGISRDVIIRLIREGVRYVVIVFRDKGFIFYTVTDKFLDSGRHYWNKNETDLQLHLSLESFSSLPHGYRL